ncbi:protease inhibitor I42 family protein [Methylosinus sp. H3A]|uniref:protease inhibitor I42 family protein n=1 Tax=Methylosinus sp. H3A TaxID=2785786 RepID=UPI0018C2419D|nr:protease inhibitor I42 family protein [Methylosinus sp. H3A]MBG0811361.1 protease inhibitor I42 family protein [Methylosinus sp. H3A]
MTKSILIAIAVILLELSAVRAKERSLSLAAGETRTIEFVENPSTGYVWRFDRAASGNPAIVRVGEDGFSPSGGESDRPFVGAPGRRRFRVEAVAVGRARLVFVEERPWEKRPVQRRVVEVRVR